MEIVAFYLPQFHAIAENDLWWGQGFTEWDNVRAATPCFEGHYQPHIPHSSLGYYDLSDPETIERQHRLALRYGVGAFCYYYYNFSGHTLLETPLRLILQNSRISNRFCLCWANQDWTRVWYGQNKEVLIRQEYSRENAIRIFHGVEPYLTDKRNIRIAGKPLFLVYDPESNPLMREYSEIWRERAAQSGLGDLFLVNVEALCQRVHPAQYGFDAAVEFAPDWVQAVMTSQHGQYPRHYDYQATVRNMLLKEQVPYKRMRCVFPGWDNTPRYKKVGIVFKNSSLGIFRYALENALEYTRRYLPEEMQYVFINAWNEWGEGCHLEPDERYGFSTLQIVRSLIREQ